jgi:SAM-dependent methyltransferase
MMNTLYICLKSDLKHVAKTALRRTFGLTVKKAPSAETNIKSSVSVFKIKRLLIKNGLAVMDGQPTWFYTAYERGDQDPLTNHALNFILQNVSREAKILVTGCGTGITSFYLADQGYRHIDAFDYLQQCVDIANDVSKLGRYEIKFYKGDGFDPELGDKVYDVVTALHWVFSAWMGNYGNEGIGDDRSADPQFREKLLTDFLCGYTPHISRNGLLIVELIDAVTDYRIASDHFMGEYSKRIYPVRHTPEQVERSAAAAGMKILQKNLCVSYSHHPRTQYILEKV